jgi:tripartite-type tricarboxylate transporter receptor subunit TctC
MMKQPMMKQLMTKRTLFKIRPAPVLISALLLTLSSITTLVSAQSSWPSHPLRLLIPYAAGGSTDILGRRLALKLGEELKQPVVVENKGGANGGIGVNSFVKSPFDDHYFMVVSYTQLAINPFIYKEKLGYDPDSDLTPIGMIAQTPNVVVVSNTIPINSLKDLVEYGKSRPGKLAYSSAGIGSTGHLLNELFKSQTGVDMVHIPYRGNGPAMQALLSGEVQFNTDNLPQLIPQIKAGKIKPLAVTSNKRWFQLPDVPTAEEAGFAGLTTVVWFGLVGQAKLPKEITLKMNTALNRLLKSNEFNASLKEVSLETVPGSPEDMVSATKIERERWKRVIEISGATAE